jgi:hypothetical protein
VIESGHIVLSDTATNLNTDSKVKAAYLGGQAPRTRSVLGGRNKLQPAGRASPKEKRFL